jgi:hypothetical protein
MQFNAGYICRRLVPSGRRKCGRQPAFGNARPIAVHPSLGAADLRTADWSSGPRCF